MTKYEDYSFGDFADLQHAFDLIERTLSGFDEDGRKTQDFEDLSQAMFLIGNSICYGEERFNDLVARFL